MEFRLAKDEDMKDIMIIIKKAQAYLKDQGIDQWQNNYPNIERMENDIDNNELYLLAEDNNILGIIALSFRGESTYDQIYEGQWITNNDYGVTNSYKLLTASHVHKEHGAMV